MSENDVTPRLPSQIIFDNLKELLRAKNTAHESMFKFHWKKMWPFSLIWPQVDYERIVRLMSEIRKNAIARRKGFVNRLPRRSGPGRSFAAADSPRASMLRSAIKNASEKTVSYG